MRTTISMVVTALVALGLGAGFGAPDARAQVVDLGDVDFDVGGGFVGGSGVGARTVSGGTLNTNFSTFIGRDLLAHGIAIVEGDTAVWNIGDQVHVGVEGLGVLTIEQGAIVMSATDLRR